MENDKIWGIRTQKPLNRLTKIGIGDYVSDMTPHAKIQPDCPSGVSWRMSEI